MQELKTLQAHDRAIQKSSDGIAVLFLMRPTCPICRMIMPEMADLVEKLKDDATFYQADIVVLKKLASEYHVQGVPTFVIFDEGRIVRVQLGANMWMLERAVMKVALERKKRIKKKLS
jgi:thioredoxin 1